MDIAGHAPQAESREDELFARALRFLYERRLAMEGLQAEVRVSKLEDGQA